LLLKLFIFLPWRYFIQPILQVLVV